MIENALSYDPDTGAFTWRSGRRFAGLRAGCLHNGYVVIRVDRVAYRAHRLAWEFTNGAIPAGFDIDHVNRNRADNRLANLRLATRSQNQANRTPNAARALPKGVSFCKQTGRFTAHISARGVQKNLGRFDTAELAALAYGDAARLLHGEFACLTN